jgi:ABC-type Fe3+ transport system permease subunit
LQLEFLHEIKPFCPLAGRGAAVTGPHRGAAAGVRHLQAEGPRKDQGGPLHPVTIARLKRFDNALEEAAQNLGATHAAVLWTVTLPYLKPALIGAAAISFLMSFENFNTTLMLVGSDPPLTIMMYGRMREGASPVLNAVSLFLMVASALLALVLMRQPAAERGAR